MLLALYSYLGVCRNACILSDKILKYMCSAVQCSAVQCSAVQCSAVQCSAVQCSAVQCSAVQWSAVQCSTLLCRAGQCSAVPCRSLEWSYWYEAWWPAVCFQKQSVPPQSQGHMTTSNSFYPVQSQWSEINKLTLLSTTVYNQANYFCDLLTTCNCIDSFIHLNYSTYHTRFWRHIKKYNILEAAWGFSEAVTPNLAEQDEQAGWFAWFDGAEFISLERIAWFS